MANELKPCICGKTPRIERKKGMAGITKVPFYREQIVCRCGVSSKLFKRPGQAVTAWNTRPAAPVEGLEYDRIINHVNSYGTTHEEDPRRIYTKCQLDLAIRLASKTIVTRTKLDDLETVVVSYGNDLVSRSQAEAIIAAKDAKLREINDLLDEGQGDDDGAQILPDFEDGMSVLGKVEACLHLLEKCRDVIEGFEANHAALTARVKELDHALTEKRRDRIGDTEKAGEFLCRAEKAEAKVEALETQLAAAKERETKAFKAGYVLACCNVVHQHDEPTIAHDALAELGVTKAEVKAMNLSEFDMKALRIIERDRATSPYAKRKPKARAALEGQP